MDFVGLNHFMYKSTPTDYSQVLPESGRKRLAMENKMKRRSNTKGEIKIKGWKGKQEEIKGSLM